jgi:hypothetical protein
MAQTGFTPIQLYYSSTTTNVPLAANLANGELAINITDGKLFYKDNSAAVQVIGWKTVPTSAGGTGLISYTAGDLPYYASGTALSKLGIGAANYVLTSSGSAPQYVAQSTLSVGSATNATNIAITDNVVSSATWYPTIVSATTGNLPGTTSSTKLSFVPSTGVLSITGANLSGLTASSAVATDASKNLVSVTNTGTGNNVLATSPTLVTPALGTPSSVNLSNATSLAVAALPTGSVIQVVQATLTSSFSTTAASFTSTGLTASITPQFSTSKILVLISTYGLAAVANGQASYTIYRGSTNLASGSGLNQSFSELVATLSLVQAPLAISYLDSPSTTSSTSYTLYAASITAGNAIYINNASGTAAIILMEIR